MSKWLTWLGGPLFVAISLLVMYQDGMGPGLGILAFFSSMFIGIQLGGFLGRNINTYALRLSPEFGMKFSAAFSAFAFLFLPALVGNWTNTHLGTDIEMEPLVLHFVWACIVGVLVYYVAPSKTEQ